LSGAAGGAIFEADTVEESMPRTREKYLIAGVDVYHVRNRNEQRVAKSLREHLESRGLTDLSPEAIKDAYASALNRLSPRYAQRGTIVLREPVRVADIEAAVEEGLSRALGNPK
jgi:hypothetical protein